MIAFAVSLTVGASVDNPAGAVIARSLLAMAVAWPVGFGLGMVLEHLFRDQGESELMAGSQTAQMESGAGESADDVEIIDEPDVESNGSGVAEASASTAA